MFLLNFLDGDFSRGAVDGVNVVYALFNVVIYGIVGMYAFYRGYKGMATRNGRLTDYYRLAAELFRAVPAYLLPVNGANYYGWSNAGRVKRSEKMSDSSGVDVLREHDVDAGVPAGRGGSVPVVTTRKTRCGRRGRRGTD